MSINTGNIELFVDSLVKINDGICCPIDGKQLTPTWGLRRSKQNLQGHILLSLSHWCWTQSNSNIGIFPDIHQGATAAGRTGSTCLGAFQTPIFTAAWGWGVLGCGRREALAAREVLNKDLKWQSCQQIWAVLPSHMQASCWLIFLITSKIHGEF